MPYYDAQGREIEDGEGDNMRRDQAEYWRTHDKHKHDYIDDQAEASEAQRQAEQEAARMRTIEGCYTISFHGEDWYPCRWQEDEEYTGWRWILGVGYFEIQAVCFPTSGEAWAWVYQQVGDHQIAMIYHPGVCSGCNLYSEALSPGGHCVNCSMLDREPAEGFPF